MSKSKVSLYTILYIQENSEMENSLIETRIPIMISFCAEGILQKLHYREALFENVLYRKASIEKI